MNCTKIASLAALAAVVAAPLAASAQTHSYGDGRYNDGSYRDQGGFRSLTGVIASANSGDLTLRNGRTIFLKHGTVIDPRGQSLQAGQRIWVRGTNAGDGNLNAQTIRIAGDARSGNGYDNDDRSAAQRRRHRDHDRDDRGYNNRDNGDQSDDRDTGYDRDNH